MTGAGRPVIHACRGDRPAGACRPPVIWHLETDRCSNGVAIDFAISVITAVGIGSLHRLVAVIMVFVLVIALINLTVLQFRLRSSV